MDNNEMSYFLWNYIFGYLSEGEVATIILSAKTISSILVFLFLFGNYIARYFSDVANVYFVRVRSRKCWTCKNVAIVISSTLLYTFFFIILEIIIYSIQLDTLVWDAEMPQTILYIMGILIPVLIILTLLVNTIAIQWGISVGIIIAAVITVVLEIVAIIFYNHSASIIFNPFCFNISLLDENRFILSKVLTNCAYAGISICGFVWYINRLDIWGKEI